MRTPCQQWRDEWHPPLEVDPWYPTTEDDREAGSAERFAFARSRCNVCPLIQQCGMDGLHEDFGMWGGMTPRERRRLRDGKTEAA